MIEKERSREGDQEEERGRREIEREKRDKELVFTAARFKDTRWLCSDPRGVLSCAAPGGVLSSS